MLSSLVKRLPLSLLDRIHSFILNDYTRTLHFVNGTDPQVFHEIGNKKVVQTFQHAASTVPAYQQFLKKSNIDPKMIKTADDFVRLVPQTDKENYIKKYSMEQRCVTGKFPKFGNIDESGGTSGKAANWIRSVQENALLSTVAKFEFEYIYNVSQRNVIVLSAWSSGPWATGIKFCQLMQQYTLVKNTGPNVKNIVETLHDFGPQYEYILAGYPPFLKKFVDEADIDFTKYKIHLLTGGEGSSVQWKAYLHKRVGKNSIIVSSYGASDIDIGVGFETPFCSFVRALLVKNHELRSALFGDLPTLPMLFQYNPMMHHIIQTYNKELGKQEYTITLLDTAVASPKVRYNLHDEGGIFRYDEFLELLQRYEPSYYDHYMKKHAAWHILKLPFLFVAGRSDGTISLDGANVYPEQVEAGILKEGLQKKTAAFFIYKAIGKNHNERFTVALQLKKGVRKNFRLTQKFQQAILAALLDLNPDFAESYRCNKHLCLPDIHLYAFDSSLFANDDDAVKIKYVKQ